MKNKIQNIISDISTFKEEITSIINNAESLKLVTCRCHKELNKEELQTYRNFILIFEYNILYKKNNIDLCFDDFNNIIDQNINQIVVVHKKSKYDNILHIILVK